MYDAIAGHDPKDATSLASAPTSATAQIERSISGLRIGIDRDYALRDIDPGQAASIEEALKVLASLGAPIVDVTMPDRSAMRDTWLSTCAPEALVFHKDSYPARANDYGVYFRQFLAMGAAVTPEQAATARAWRTEFSARFTAVWSPSTPWPARPAAPRRGRSRALNCWAATFLRRWPSHCRVPRISRCR